MTRTINLKQLRPKLPQVMGAIERRMDRYVVTWHGVPTAVMMNVEELEGLLETLDILEDKAGLKRLKKAFQEVKSGQTRSLEEIDRKLGRVSS